MKQFKKLISIMLAAALFLSLATVAMAAGTNSITVNNAEPGATYNIYKMMSLTNSGTNYSYKVESDWNDFFTNGGAGASYVTIDDNDYVTWVDGKDAANLAPLAAKYATDKSLDALNTIKAEATTVKFENLESGYYLITSTNGTKAIIASTPTNKTETITEKNTNPTTEKQVKEDSTGVWGDDNSAQIGDTVEFKATVNIEPGAINYVMHDKMDEALTFDTDSVKVYTTWNTNGEGNVELPDSNYTVTFTDLTDDCTFEVAFTNEYLKTIIADTTLTVTYTAVLNDKAKVDTGVLNKEQLTWGDKTTSESAWDQTETKTYQFEILKYANGDADKTPLAGATFELYNASHKDSDGKATLVKLVKVEETEAAVTYRVATATDSEDTVVTQFTTVAGKKIIIKGVDLDNYELKEISAPDGFNLPKTNFTQKVDDNTLTWEVENKSGTELPSTGGMGTTLFYLLGTVLVASAGILLVTKRRMAK